MKITAGLGSIDDYIPYAQAGADEVFCGYVPDSWAVRYGMLYPLNRREVLCYNVQLGAESELRILKKMTAAYGVPAHLTFNSLYYIPEQYPIIADIISRCVEIGFETFIIADLALILYLRNKKIPCRIHLSGETSEINRKTLEYFEEFDLERIIFHRKNSLEDMESCISHMKGRRIVEFEAFALNEMCHFSGAFCNSLHCDELGHLCRVPYWLGRASKDSSERAALLTQRQNHSGSGRTEVYFESEETEMLFQSEETEAQEGNLTGATGCGLCALYRMQKAGVTHLKLVGRGNHTDCMQRDIRQMKNALHILENSENEAQFQREMKRALFSGGTCSGECYYRITG